MIVSGKILTNVKPVAIENLKAGDVVIGRGDRPHRVAEIEQASVTRVITFARNTALRVTEDATLRTLYGDRRADDILGRRVVMMDAARRSITDTASAEDVAESVTAYRVVLEDGNDFYASGYCLKAGK